MISRLITLHQCLIVCCVVNLIGCNQATNRITRNESNEDLSEKPRIGLIMKSLANEFFATMEKGAREHQAENQNYELICNGIKDETDLARQVALVNEMVASKVDAIVIAPADSKALIPSLRRAMKAGVVVVNIDNQLDKTVMEKESVNIPFVGPDNRAGAKMVGNYLASQLNPGDKVAILEGKTSAYNGIQRRLGFEDAAKENNLKIVSSQSADWETDKANTITSSMLREFPDIKAILASNDSMALGAVAAIKSSGRANEIKVIGFDNISAMKKLLENGTVLATADQHASELAVFGIEIAIKLLEKQTDVTANTQTPVDLIIKDIDPS
ncbi:sugar ABC transporter substrate-binding protein [Rhodopirellula sp.]|nr:sugar ABC transporter substrate-binding protein [Rhodopirellula sp.]